MMIMMKYLLGIIVIGPLLGSALPVASLYGDYHFAAEAVTLKLSAPDSYTYFATEYMKRSGSVTSKELSRGTFTLTGDTLRLSEFPAETIMTLVVDSEEKLRVVQVKELHPDDILLSWNKYYADGTPRLEAGWRRGKKHGTWVYYNEDGDVMKTETYKRGKLKD